VGKGLAVDIGRGLLIGGCLSRGKEGGRGWSRGELETS